MPGLIDDGEWAGVPWAASARETSGVRSAATRPGGTSRWRHAFQPVGADVFSVFVGRADGISEAHVLAGGWRPPELASWGFNLPVGAGTYHALFPRAWQAFEPEALGGLRLVGEQLSPVIGGDYERSALPVASVEWRLEADAEPLTVGLMLSWANPLGAHPGDTPCPRARARRPSATRRRPGSSSRTARWPGGLRGSFAIAAGAAEGVALTTRTAFEARFDKALWADFADDGRLIPRRWRTLAARHGR